VFDDGAGPSLYAGGRFTIGGSVDAVNIARWDGHAWAPLQRSVQPEHEVRALAVFGRDLAAATFFHELDDEYGVQLALWRGCRGPGTLVCFGDGTSSPCPCANDGEPRHGCDNSRGSGGGLLSSTGSTSPDSVVLHASGELASALTLVVQSDVALATPTPYGDGIGCLGGQVRRLHATNAVAGEVSVPGPGDPPITARSAALGDPIGAGSIRYYQAVYRDPSTSFCTSGGALNATNALRIDW